MRESWVGIVQLLILLAALIFCLEFVYSHGLMEKDAITVGIVAVVAVLIKMLERFIPPKK